jgi:hypothetical protein
MFNTDVTCIKVTPDTVFVSVLSNHICIIKELSVIKERKCTKEVQTEWVCWLCETRSLICFIPFKKRYHCFGRVFMTELFNVESCKEQASIYCTWSQLWIYWTLISTTTYCWTIKLNPFTVIIIIVLLRIS